MKYILTGLLLALTFLLISSSCGVGITKPIIKPAENISKAEPSIVPSTSILTGAENYSLYLPLLKDKKVGVVTNQTGIVRVPGETGAVKDDKGVEVGEYEGADFNQSIVDFFVSKNCNLVKIFAPEHGFRGTADAGEHVVDAKDTKTGLPIISLYGDNKKPKPNQLAGIDVLVFDIQDVGVRFYTYISTLHYVMEACAENSIPLIVLDRPNPNGSIIDGPVLDARFSSFVGMHPIPILHGMTIGEYAKMINGEGWLKNGMQCTLNVIPCSNYNREMPYSLPVNPSPNLPNDQAINLYASLCLFEGTNVSVGRGTKTQFQVYGSPFLKNMPFEFIPEPNFGAKDPMHKGRKCFGENLTKINKINQLELKWLMKAFNSTADKTLFFNDFFTKLTGSKNLQEQIEKGVSEAEIRKSWGNDLAKFRTIRQKYLIY